MSGIKVQIFGETYTINADLDETYVRTVAAYVDQKMNEAARQTPFMDRTKWAVLAALAVADEFHRLQDANADREDAMRDTVERCLKVVDGVLKEHGVDAEAESEEEQADSSLRSE